MATLAKNKLRNFGLGDLAEHPAVAADIIYLGAAVGINAGNARPLVAGDEFAGFADKKADNSLGAAGDIKVRVRERGLIELAVTGAGATSIGDTVYATDDDTFTLTKAANAIKIGRVMQHVTGTTVMVDFKATGLQTGIADPAGGATVDAESRTAIGSIIDALEVAGIVLPV